MIVITGATGVLGAGVVEHLLAHTPADGIAVSVRDPARAATLAERGVRVRRGDFAEPATLRDAFEGATQVLIVSIDSLGPEAVDCHRVAIDAAVRSGAQRILYTSHMGAHPNSAFAPGGDHAATEAALERCGVPFTALRNGFYASSALQLIGPGLQAGTIAVPADGPVSWTTRADLAEATAAILLEPGRFDGPTPPLTAGEALDFDGLARVATEVTGREITRTTVTADEYVAAMVAHGAPEAAARLLLGMFQAARAGDFAAVDPTLERLLGRRPQTMRDVLTMAT